MMNFFSGAIYGSATTFMLVGMVYVTQYGLPERLVQTIKLIGNI